MSTGRTDVEQRLQSVLADRASDVVVRGDPWQRTSARIRSARRRRHMTIGAAVSLSLVLVAAVVVAPWQSREVPAVALGGVATGDVRSWPVRGSLSGDSAYLAGAIAAFEKQGLVKPHIVYAGDLAASRVVLGIGGPRRSDGSSSGGNVETLVAGRGAPVGELEPADWGPASMSRTDDRVVTWVGAPQGADTQWLVLAPSELEQAEVSQVPTYDEDGTPHRTWTPLRLVNGVATGEMSERRLRATRIRVLAGAGAVYDGPLSWAYTTPPESGPLPRVNAAVERPAPGNVTPSLVDLVAIVRRLASDHDVAAADVDVDVQWSGRLDAEITGLLVVMRLPDGSAFQSLWVEDARGEKYSGEPVSGRPIARSGAELAPVVWHYWEEGAQRRLRLYVVAPGAAEASLYYKYGQAGARGRLLATVPLEDGFGRVTVDASVPDAVQWNNGLGVTLVTRTDAGTVTWPVKGPYDDDPLDVHADR